MCTGGHESFLLTRSSLLGVPFGTAALAPLRTVIILRSSNFFVGWPAYYAGATDTPYCTIYEDTTMEGGWEHTLPSSHRACTQSSKACVSIDTTS